jgi:hypothetical protein
MAGDLSENHKSTSGWTNFHPRAVLYERDPTRRKSDMHDPHLTYALPLVTFLAIVAYLGWNWYSTKRSQETGGRTSGFGGPNDPVA